MPSAEETTYLIEVMPESNIKQDSFTSHDVDVLVSRIKENLRLSSLKSRSSLASSHRLRASPYKLPSSRSSWQDGETGSICELCCSTTSSSSAVGCCANAASPTTTDSSSIFEQDHHNHHHHHHHNHKHYRRYRKSSPLDLDDSYERFQALLRSGALIKEAVKRLQTCPDAVLDDVLDDSDEEDSGVKRRATSSRATSATFDSIFRMKTRTRKRISRREAVVDVAKDNPMSELF